MNIPEARVLEGYDVVTFSAQTSPECSPLSCNALASEIGFSPCTRLSGLPRLLECITFGGLKLDVSREVESLEAASV